MGHEDPGKEYLDCANVALQFYLQCLDANVDCEDGAYESCTSDYMVVVGECPALPAGAQSMFDGCIQ